ncbi:tdp2, partial [Symbiodinium microadriaticum]
MTQSRLLPTVLLAASSWLLISLLGSQTTFLTGTSPAGSSRQSRTAMRGFKDDFYAWKDSLSKDEQALLLKQAQNEFDKKFRKSDEFSQDLPEEKIQSFAKVLKKFFDN